MARREGEGKGLALPRGKPSIRGTVLPIPSDGQEQGRGWGWSWGRPQPSLGKCPPIQSAFPEPESRPQELWSAKT